MSDYKMQYAILKKIICLYYGVSEIMFLFQYCKIQFLNHFFNIYFLRVNISVTV